MALLQFLQDQTAYEMEATPLIHLDNFFSIFFVVSLCYSELVCEAPSPCLPFSGTFLILMFYSVLDPHVYDQADVKGLFYLVCWVLEFSLRLVLELAPVLVGSCLKSFTHHRMITPIFATSSVPGAFTIVRCCICHLSLVAYPPNAIESLFIETRWR
jgi:hypothetical protein